MDDFGIKYFHTNDAHHVLNSLSHYYKISVASISTDTINIITWKSPCCLTYLLKSKLWSQASVILSTSRGSIQLSRPGQKQCAPEPDTFPSLNKTLKTRVQSSIVGSLLYYDCTINSSLLSALNTISTFQSGSTEHTFCMRCRLLDYTATYPEAHLHYHTGSMILDVYSNAAYLVAPKACSRIADF